MNKKIYLKAWLSRLKLSRRACFISLGVLGVLFVLYLVAGFWILPSYLTSKAKSIAKEKLQREITIQSIDLNPITFRLEINGFRLSEAKNDATFVSFDQLLVEFSAYSLLKLTPVITEFKLVKPYAKVIRYHENERNFDDILALIANDQKEVVVEKKVEEPTRAPRNAEERRQMYAKRKFGLYNLQIIDATFEFENQEIGSKTVVKDFNVGMPLVYRGPIKGITRFVEPKFEALINGKKLEIISEKPDSTSRDRLLRLTINNIDLKRVFNYVPLQSPYQFKEGWLDLNVTAYFHRPKIGQRSIDFGGDLTLRSIRMDQGKEPLLNVEKIFVDLGKLSPAQGSFQLKKIEVIKPEIYAIKDKNGFLNLTNLFVNATESSIEKEDTVVPKAVSYQGTPKTKEEGVESDKTIYSLDTLLIKQAKIHYEDQSPISPFSAKATNVHVNVNNLSFDQNEKALDVEEVVLSDAQLNVLLETKSDPISKNQSGMPNITLRAGKISLQNLNGQIHNKISEKVDSIPFLMQFQNAAINLHNMDAILASNTIHFERVHTSGALFDMTLIDHPEVISKATELLPYNLSFDQIHFAPKLFQIKNQNTHLFSDFPQLVKTKNVQIYLEAVNAQLSTGKIHLEKMNITDGNVVAMMDQKAPQIPKPIKKGAVSPYHITLNEMTIQTVVQLTNGNKYDPFQVPYVAQLAPLSIVLNQIDANLTAQNISVKKLTTQNSNAIITLENYKKPTAYGIRTEERAELMTQIIETSKKQRTSGLMLKVDQIDIVNWKTQLKNNNKTNRSGLPIDAIVEKLNLSIGNTQFDTGLRSLVVGSVVSKSANVKGQINPHENYVVKFKVNEKPIDIPTDPLAISIGKVDISGWAVKGRNLALKKSLGSSVTGLVISGEHISSQSNKPGRFSVKAKVNEGGNLLVDGQISLFPLSLDANVDLREVSIVLIQPYIDDYVNLTLDSALLSMKGNAKLKEEVIGLTGEYIGDVTISRMRTSDKVNNNRFMRWKQLDLKNVSARLNPLSIRIKEAQMDHFFSRIILSSDGRFNIQNILKSKAGGEVSLTETDQELDELASLGNEEKAKIAEEHKKARERRRSRLEKRKQQLQDQKVETLPEEKYPDVLIEKMVLKKGRIRMTDNFIKPNYTANITDIEGVIYPISLDSKTPSKLELNGKVNNAPLTATGTINLIQDPIAIELKAKVRGMELAQLSAYTNKFIGYGIKKGKLSCDIEYKIENEALVAQNRLILDQLTFDEKSSDNAKMSLPVQLAVNLLKDSNGVIDINLPIEGSLDNPNFSLGDIIGKVLFNSIKSILFSPFSFLGGTSDSHETWLAFESGTTNVLEKEQERLKKIAMAFDKYPKLNLDITGVYDVIADKKGLAKAALKRQARMKKYQDLIAKGEKVLLKKMPYSDQEYSSFIKDLYNKATFDKPKNMIFLEKSLSLSEMEDLLIDHSEVSEEDFINLAYNRAETIKSQLVRAGVSDTRIFILLSKAGQSSESGETATRVDLSFTQ